MICGVARALDVLGDRWTLLVVRELLTGPKRHADLLARLPGIATNVLSERLRRLQDVDVVTQRTLAPPASSAVYELTQRGRELQPVVISLGSWGLPLLADASPADDFHLAWAALVMLDRVDWAEVGDGGVSVQLVVGGEVVHIIAASEGHASIEEVSKPADIVIESDVDTFVRWGSGELTDTQARRRGLSISPARSGFSALRRLFPAPGPAR